MALVVKNPSANAGDLKNMDLIPRSGRSLEAGMAPFQYCCRKNPMDRGNWRAIVHRVAKNQT